MDRRAANTFTDGLRLLKEKDYRGAISLFDKILREFPNQGEVHYNKGFAHYHLGEYERAIESFNFATQFKEGYVDALNMKGLCFHLLKRYPEAKRVFMKAIEIDNTIPKPLINLARTLDELQQYTKAITYFDKALERDQSGRRPSILAYKADTLAKLENIDEAFVCLREALDINEQNQDALYTLAKIYSKLGRVEEAKEGFHKLLSISPNHYKAHADLGVLIENDDPTSAVEHYQKSLEIFPSELNTRFRLANLYFQNGMKKEAVSHYNKLITQLRAKPERSLSKPQNLGSSGGVGSGNLSTNEILMQSMKNKAICLLKSKLHHYEKSRIILQELVDRNYNDNEIYYLYAVNLYLLKEVKQSFKYFEITLKIDPNHVKSLCQQGIIYNQLGDPKKAISFFERAIEKSERSHAYSFVNKAQSYIYLKKYEQASQWLIEAIRIDPTIVESYYLRGLLYIKYKDYEKAQSYLEEALHRYKVKPPASDNVIEVNENWKWFKFPSKHTSHSTILWNLHQNILERLAFVHRKRRHYDEATQCYRQCRFDPFFEHFFAGVILLYKKEYLSAKEMFDRASKADRKTPQKYIDKMVNYIRFCKIINRSTKKNHYIDKKKLLLEHLELTITHNQFLDNYSMYITSFRRIQEKQPSFAPKLALTITELGRNHESISFWALVIFKILSNHSIFAKEMETLRVKYQKSLKTPEFDESKLYNLIYIRIIPALIGYLDITKSVLSDIISFLRTTNHQSTFLFTDLDSRLNYFKKYFSEKKKEVGKRIVTAPTLPQLPIIFEPNLIVNELTVAAGSLLLPSTNTENNSLSSSGNSAISPRGSMSNNNSGSNPLITFTTYTDEKLHYKLLLSKVQTKNIKSTYQDEVIFDCLNKAISNNNLSPSTILMVQNGNLYSVYKTYHNDRLNLLEIAKVCPDFTKYIDEAEFTLLLILSILCNPFFVSLDHIFVDIVMEDNRNENNERDLKIRSLRPVEITCNGLGYTSNTHRSSSSSSSYHRHPHQVITEDELFTVRNIMYVFPQMDHQISSEFKQHFLQDSPSQIILRFLQLIYLHNESVFEMITERSLFPTEVIDQLGIPITIPKHLCTSLLTNLEKIQSLLKRQRDVTNRQLLEIVHPKMAEFYMKREKSRPVRSPSISRRISSPSSFDHVSSSLSRIDNISSNNNGNNSNNIDNKNEDGKNSANTNNNNVESSHDNEIISIEISADNNNNNNNNKIDDHVNDDNNNINDGDNNSGDNQTKQQTDQIHQIGSPNINNNNNSNDDDDNNNAGGNNESKKIEHHDGDEKKENHSTSYSDYDFYVNMYNDDDNNDNNNNNENQMINNDGDKSIEISFNESKDEDMNNSYLSYSEYEGDILETVISSTDDNTEMFSVSRTTSSGSSITDIDNNYSAFLSGDDNDDRKSDSLSSSSNSDVNIFNNNNTNNSNNNNIDNYEDNIIILNEVQGVEIDTLFERFLPIVKGTFPELYRTESISSFKSLSSNFSRTKWTNLPRHSYQDNINQNDSINNVLFELTQNINFSDRDEDEEGDEKRHLKSSFLMFIVTTFHKIITKIAIVDCDVTSEFVFDSVIKQCENVSDVFISNCKSLLIDDFLHSCSLLKRNMPLRIHLNLNSYINQQHFEDLKLILAYHCEHADRLCIQLNGKNLSALRSEHHLVMFIFTYILSSPHSFAYTNVITFLNYYITKGMDINFQFPASGYTLLHLLAKYYFPTRRPLSNATLNFRPDDDDDNPWILSQISDFQAKKERNVPEGEINDWIHYVVEFFRKKSANFEIEDSTGRTPYVIALKDNNVECLLQRLNSSN